MKTEDLILLGAVGYGAYVLTKPVKDLVGGVAGGVSAAVGGAGAGVSTAFQGVGSGLAAAGSGIGESVAEIGGGIASPFHAVDEYLELKLEGMRQEEEFNRAFDDLANEYALLQAQQAGDVKGETLVVQKEIDLSKSYEDLIEQETDTGRAKIRKHEKLLKADIEATQEVERKGLFQSFLTKTTSGGLGWLSKQFSTAGRRYNIKDKSLFQRGKDLLSGIRSIKIGEQDNLMMTNPFSTQFIGSSVDLGLSTPLEITKTSIGSSGSKSKKVRSGSARSGYRRVTVTDKRIPTKKRNRNIRVSLGFLKLARSRGIGI